MQQLGVVLRAQAQSPGRACHLNKSEATHTSMPWHSRVNKGDGEQPSESQGAPVAAWML